MARFTPLRVLVGTSLFASLALAQTAAQISQEQLTLATLIPTTCNTQCQAWLSTLGVRPRPRPQLLTPKLTPFFLSETDLPRRSRRDLRDLRL